MSNGQSPINLTRIASPSMKGGAAPLPGSGESAKKEAGKYAPVTEHTVVKRTIPVTDPVEVDEPETEAPAPVKPADAAAEQTRHEKWKAAQAEKKAATEAAKLETLAKRQGLASVLLSKGDLPGAAKALGIPASELVTLVNQAAMGLKPEPSVEKPLTPEEQRAKDEAAFREEMKVFRKEQEDYRNTQAMTGFIEKSIRPILADKDAYEMIHAAGAADVETYAYRYMNEHYYATSEKDAAGKIVKPGEVLEAKDVLDAIEENLVKAAEATLARQRAVKKLGKHFAPPAALGEEGGAPVTEVAPGATALTGSRRAQIAQALAELEAGAGTEEPAAEVEEEEASPVGNPAAPKIVRTPIGGGNVRAVALMRGRLTPAEKIARARAEEEAAARASLTARRR